MSQIHQKLLFSSICHEQLVFNSTLRCVTGIPVEKCVSSPYGIILPHRQRLNDLPEFQRGYFEMQDEASQIAALKVQVGMQFSRLGL